MNSAIDLPLRGGVAPRLAEEAAVAAAAPTSFVAWVKAGFAFTVGAWLAGVLLFMPSILLYLRFLAWFLEMWARAALRAH